jgi:hypothetical protein
MYLSPWFLTLFAYVLPMDLVMRIYDLVFLQGAAIETMMRVALSLLMRLSPHIMSLGDFEDIVTFLSSKKMITDDDCFIQDSLQLCGYVTRTKLEQLQEKYEQKKKKENGYFKVDSSHASSLIEKRRYDDGTLLKSVINKKKTKKMIKNWFGTISSNKSKVSPPEITPPSKPSSPPSILESNSNNNDTMLLHQQIEDLLAALSLVQKENMTLKNDLYEQTTRSKSNAMLESRMKQLSKELQEMTVDRNLQLQEKEEAKHHAHELRKQLDALDKSRAWSTRNSLDGLRRNNSMLSDSSSSSSSYSSNKDDNEVPHLLPSPLTFEKPFSPSIITLRYKSSDII